LCSNWSKKSLLNSNQLILNFVIFLEVGTCNSPLIEILIENTPNLYLWLFCMHQISWWKEVFNIFRKVGFSLMRFLKCSKFNTLLWTLWSFLNYFSINSETNSLIKIPTVVPWAFICACFYRFFIALIYLALVEGVYIIIFVIFFFSLTIYILTFFYFLTSFYFLMHYEEGQILLLTIIGAIFYSSSSSK